MDVDKRIHHSLSVGGWAGQVGTGGGEVVRRNVLRQTWEEGGTRVDVEEDRARCALVQ